MSFYRDSLVAENLQHANRIAYGAQRYQVITLNGELIQTSGAMSGGGNPLRGRMGTQVIPNVINQEYYNSKLSWQNFLVLAKFYDIVLH